MNENISKNIKKIIIALDGLDKLPRKIIIFGSILSIIILFLGTVLFYISNDNLDYSNIHLISISLIKSSIIILAESIIGGLSMDYLGKR